jgi:PAS domain S-box-containing protein
MNNTSSMEPNPQGRLDSQILYDAFNASPIGIAVENLDGQPIFVNPTFCSLLGFSEDELRHKHCVDFSPPEDAQKDWALFQKLRAGSIDHYQLEKRYFRKDGSLMWGRLTVSMLNNLPSPLVLAMVDDITEKKTAEQAIRDSEERLRLAAEEFKLAMEAAGIGGWDFDLSSGCNLWFGNAHAQLGMTPDEGSSSEAFWAHVHPDDYAVLRNALRAAKRDHTDLNREFRVVWADGTIHWLHSMGRYYYRATGEAERMLGMSIDITDRKRAEEARYRHAAIVESSEDAIASGTLDGTIVSWNPGAEHMYGYTEAEAVGKPITFLVPPELGDEEKRILETLRRGGRIEHFETVRLTKAGRRINVSLTISPIKDANGFVVGLSGIARDITERKRAGEALKKSEEKFAKAFRDSPLALTLTSAKDHRYLDVNQTFELLTGWRRDEVIGRTPFDIRVWVDPNERVEFAKRIMSEGAVRNLEFRYRCRDGNERIGLGSGELIEIDDQPCILAVIADITDRRLAEDRLREYEKAVEATEEMIAVVDREYRYLIANRQYLKMRNVTKEQVVGHLIPDVLDKEMFKTAVKPELDECFEGRVVRYEGRFSYPGVGERDLLLSYFPIEGANGTIDRAACILHDVTERKRAEEALQESEERLRLAIQAGKMYAYEWDVATDALVRSPECANVLGATEPRTLTHEQAKEKIHPEDRPKLVAAVARHSPENPTVALTYRVLLADKSPVWVRSTGRAFFDGEGRMLRVVGIVADITDQKLAEEALRASEERLRLAQKVAGIGTFERNLRTGVNTWTEEMESMYGLPPGSFGRTRTAFGNLVHPDDRAEVMKLVDEALKTTQPVSGEWRVIWPDGSVHWITGRWQLLRDESGEPSRVVGANIDITGRKQAEEALKESEGRFRLVADTAPVMIWMSGPDKACSYFNRPWLGFTGRSIEQESGHGWEKGIHPDDLQKTLDAYSQSFDQREEFSMEYRLRRHDGEYRWVLDSGIPRFNQDGSFAGYIGSCIDVTERKQAEEALSGMTGKLIEAQEQERARIARELHDDVAQRLAMLTIELEQLERNPSQVRSRLQALRQETTEIAGDVQALSHELHSSKLEYLGAVAGIRGWCREFSQRQGVEISFRSDVSNPLPLEIGLCLFRVVQEALNNSLKHSGVKQIEVKLAQQSNEVHLTIIDSGRGFDVEATIQGEGLGLVSMRERVRLVNGTINIESKPTGGTAIRVRVPLTARSAQRAAG